MKPVAAAVGRWLAPETPAERLAAVRILVGGFAALYLTLRIPHLVSYFSFSSRHFEPVGVMAMFDRPPPAALAAAVMAIALLACVGFALGWRFRVTGPVSGLSLLWILCYANSWGQIFHTENALVLSVIVLGLTRAADASSLDARRRLARARGGGREREARAVLGVPPTPSPRTIVEPPPPHARYGWPLRLLCLIVVATYLLAGIAKLRWGGPGWMGGTVLRDTIAADSLRKILLGSSHSPLAEALLGQGWLFRSLAWLTLVVELGAPLALIHRRAALAWVAAVILFHLGVLALMTILFPYPLSGVAFAPFFRAERFTGWVARRIKRFRERRSPAGSAAP